MLSLRRLQGPPVYFCHVLRYCLTVLALRNRRKGVFPTNWRPEQEFRFAGGTTYTYSSYENPRTYCWRYYVPGYKTAVVRTDTASDDIYILSTHKYIYTVAGYSTRPLQDCTPISETNHLELESSRKCSSKENRSKYRSSISAPLVSVPLLRANCSYCRDE